MKNEEYLANMKGLLAAYVVLEKKLTNKADKETTAECIKQLRRVIELEENPTPQSDGELAEIKEFMRKMVITTFYRKYGPQA